jgi:BirA family transcriptional regulator, biotin operon repressor / biotin---[acetyl-CoA-carboxylase] ligase
MASDGLAAAVEALPSPWQGHYFESVDSTQDEARAGAQRGAPHRSVFVADFQRAGRGRQGRTWSAGAGMALLVSVVFRETNTAPVSLRWTSLASVALAEAIEDLFEVKAAIKWPNDLMLNDRKLAGILGETSWDGNRLVAIVGVGVNVNTPAADLVAIPGPATSLAAACGREVDRAQLLLKLVDRVEFWMERPWLELHTAWESRLWGRGQRLCLLDSGREEAVVVLGANADGSLRVRTENGIERTTTTGELII